MKSMDNEWLVASFEEVMSSRQIVRPSMELFMQNCFYTFELYKWISFSVVKLAKARPIFAWFTRLRCSHSQCFSLWLDAMMEKYHQKAKMSMDFKVHNLDEGSCKGKPYFRRDLPKGESDTVSHNQQLRPHQNKSNPWLRKIALSSWAALKHWDLQAWLVGMWYNSHLGVSIFQYRSSTYYYHIDRTFTSNTVFQQFF